MRKTAKRCRLVRGKKKLVVLIQNVDFGVGVKKRKSAYGV